MENRIVLLIEQEQLISTKWTKSSPNKLYRSPGQSRLFLLYNQMTVFVKSQLIEHANTAEINNFCLESDIYRVIRSPIYLLILNRDGSELR